MTNIPYSRCTRSCHLLHPFFLKIYFSFIRKSDLQRGGEAKRKALPSADSLPRRWTGLYCFLRIQAGSRRGSGETRIRIGDLTGSRWMQVQDLATRIPHSVLRQQDFCFDAVEFLTLFVKDGYWSLICHVACRDLLFCRLILPFAFHFLCCREASWFAVVFIPALTACAFGDVLIPVSWSAAYVSLQCFDGF